MHDCDLGSNQWIAFVCTDAGLGTCRVISFIVPKWGATAAEAGVSDAKYALS